MSSKSVIIGLVTVFLVVSSIVYLSRNRLNLPLVKQQSSTEKIAQEMKEEEKRASHFISSFPKHSEVMIVQPFAVVISSDIAPDNKSNVVVKKGEDIVSSDEVIFDPDQFTLKNTLQKDLTDGTYTVEYQLCSDEESCEEGQFQFAINGTDRSQYEDLTNQEQVLVSIKDEQFHPDKIIVSEGSIITWKNDDSHTYFIAPKKEVVEGLVSNAQELRSGEVYSAILGFDNGEYPYYDIGNITSTMDGRIVIE